MLTASRPQLASISAFAALAFKGAIEIVGANSTAIAVYAPPAAVAAVPQSSTMMMIWARQWLGKLAHIHDKCCMEPTQCRLFRSHTVSRFF